MIRTMEKIRRGCGAPAGSCRGSRTSAVRSSAIDGKRCCGASAMPRRSTCSMSGGTGLSFGTALTLPPRIFTASSARSVPEKGSCRYSASYSAAQKLNWSLRLSS